MALKLEQARTIVAAALAYARAKSLKPMAFVVLDERGALRAAAAEDGTSSRALEGRVRQGPARAELGVSSRKLHDMAVEWPHFIASIATVSKEGIVPVPGGVLTRPVRSSERLGRQAIPPTMTRPR